MRIAICDNDRIFLESFARQVRNNSLVADVETYVNYDAFLGDLRENYDLVFMDIDWEREKKGIDIAAEAWKLYSSARFIMLSSCVDRFVQDLFLQKTNISGLLNKPVDPEILDAYLKKIRKMVSVNQKKVLLIKEGGRQLSIPLSDICYLEIKNHAVYINTTQGNYHVYETLGEISKRLSDDFCRCHRSYIVNMSFISGVSRTELELKNGYILPVGRTFYRQGEARYMEYLSKRI